MKAKFIRPLNCLNCGSRLASNYCEVCGQSSDVKRITFKDTVEGFLSSTFSLEGNLPKTIFALVRNPGKMFRGFIGGKRVIYYKPVAFFVVCTAAYLIIRSLINYDPLYGYSSPPEASDEIRKLTLRAARFMVDNINNIMFTLVISIGLMFKSFFYKRFHLAEYITVGFYISGIYILFGIIFMMIMNFKEERVNQFQLIFLFLYIIYCAHSLMQKNTLIGWLKYLLISAFSIIFYIIFGYGFSLIWVFFMN